MQCLSGLSLSQVLGRMATDATAAASRTWQASATATAPVDSPFASPFAPGHPDSGGPRHGFFHDFSEVNLCFLISSLKLFSSVFYFLLARAQAPHAALARAQSRTHFVRLEFFCVCVGARLPVGLD